METISDKIAESGFEIHKEQFARLAGMSECGMMITKMQAEPQIIYANDGFYRMFRGIVICLNLLQVMNSGADILF